MWYIHFANQFGNKKKLNSFHISKALESILWKQKTVTEFFTSLQWLTFQHSKTFHTFSRKYLWIINIYLQQNRCVKHTFTVTGQKSHLYEHNAHATCTDLVSSCIKIHVHVNSNFNMVQGQYINPLTPKLI